MKGLSLTQPWATLKVIDAKQVETRGRDTKFRGWLAIHASKGFPAWAKQYFMQPFFLDALVAAGFAGADALPTGAIIGMARLASTFPTERTFIGERVASFRDHLYIDERERAFGDYSPNRYAWLMPEAVALREPIPCKGALGLWDVPEDIADTIQRETGIVLPTSPSLHF
jgi:hypothetical protein